jgi:hypothetical protein
MGENEAKTIRQPRDRLKGLPQEREHSDAAGGTRDRPPPARGTLLREGLKPEGARPVSVARRAKARPAKPDVPN